MPLKEASLVKTWTVSPRVKAFRLKVLGEEPFTFVPGQWVNFHLPIKADNPQRAYSIASPPNGSHEFETAITRVEGGPGSSFFHDAPVGASLKFEGPAGRFVLRDPGKSGAAFIATGTGLTPFRSMIPHLLNQGCQPDVLLLFG
ncbi:MAG: FAD-dependent oxidoreductase, partial [Armatimonadetes bacterium]|nr:FAD-dependent oxidoreductase [Armatimonadota bacterium]